MKYKLVCIWDVIKKSRDEISVTIEVCLNVGKKSLSPFKRKITVYDLMRDFNGEYQYILDVLAGTGQIEQPFIFFCDQLNNEKLIEEINKIPAQFSRQGTSIRPLNKVYIPYHSHKEDSFNIGVLMEADIIITNVEKWWNNIDVRFLYENMVNLIGATNRTDIPYIDNNGNSLHRDYGKENVFLSNLFGKTNTKYSTLTLDKADTISLRQLIEAGWRIFIRKGGKNKMSRLRIVPNKYGIEWFTTADEDYEISDSLLDKLLTAFLKNQNFYESRDGEIGIVNNHQIEGIPADKIASIIDPIPNLKEIYSPVSLLLPQEKETLQKIIEKNVNANLMDYQFEGVVWLTEMRRHNTGCLLADDMGLGKTLQTLAYLSTRPLQSEFLVVAPTSITGNWIDEIEKFTPQLRHRITVVSFDQLRISLDNYSNRVYDTFIIDEGQMVKNSNTQRHKSLTPIQRNHTIMLSGTPIENGIHEIWAQFNLLIPGIASLQNKLKNMVSSNEDREYIELSRKLLSNFILRRTKADVLENFPNKQVNNIYIDLNKNERETYNKIKQIILKALADGITGRVNSLALTGLLRLRQACVSSQILPANLRTHSSLISSKFKKAIRIIEENVASGNKILVFSQFTSALERFKEALDERKWMSYILTGNTTDRLRIVKSFNSSDEVKIFLISLKAGGTGLNLTAANRVILLDDWWNPAVEEQAFARSYRLGQKSDVEIYRLICKNTVEEKILLLQEKKRNVSDLFNVENVRITIDEIRDLID